MNKGELVMAISEKSGLAKKDAERALNGVVDSITEALAKNDKVQLVGFGTFEVKERKERLGRDPRSGKEIKIAAGKSPAFKPGKALKDAVNQ